MLIAVVCAVIGTVTTLALRNHLYDQLNGQLGEVAARASGSFGPPGQQPGGGAAPGGQGIKPHPTTLDDLVTKGPQQGIIAARVENGAIVDAERGDKSDSDFEMSAKPLTEAQLAALEAVPRVDRAQHTVDVPGAGRYRVEYRTGDNGSYYVAVPTAPVDNTIDTLILVEVCVTAAGLVAASLAGAAIVGVATRPLRRVAATATRVSELPLHTGEVNLSERVPDAECDPHSEVGQVGAALNRMLDHVHAALHARQQSETRVRQFVADASHELRTPLASIRGYAELTRRGREQVGPDTRHALGRIESEAGRMTVLVEDLLLLARLDAGRPLRFEPTDLVPLVVDTVSDARAAGPGHNWRLELPDEPAPVTADAARVQQVLVNLLGNARHHTPPGTTVIARVRHAGPWTCVDVEDDGPGIPAELLPHVFERFARGDPARARADGATGPTGSTASAGSTSSSGSTASTGSTGLGLAIVQAVATAHGGAVTVDSVPGRTVFTVHLPQLPAPGGAAGPRAERPADSQARHSATTQVRQGT